MYWQRAHLCMRVRVKTVVSQRCHGGQSTKQSVGKVKHYTSVLFVFSSLPLLCCLQAAVLCVAVRPGVVVATQKTNQKGRTKNIMHARNANNNSLAMYCCHIVVILSSYCCHIVVVLLVQQVSANNTTHLGHVFLLLSQSLCTNN